MKAIEFVIAATGILGTVLLARHLGMLEGHLFDLGTLVGGIFGIGAGVSLSSLFLQRGPQR
jgi:hypothetical protein